MEKEYVTSVYREYITQRSKEDPYTFDPYEPFNLNYYRQGFSRENIIDYGTSQNILT